MVICLRYGYGMGKKLKKKQIAQDISVRKWIEDELTFKNVILATQQEVSIDGILVVDENGKMISFNKRFIEIWGIPSDVIESQSDERALQSVLHKLVDPEEFLDKVQYLYKNKNETSRDEILLKEGVTLDRYSAGIFGSDGKYYGRVWFFRDVTKQKQVEQALKTSRERFRLFADYTYNWEYWIGADGKFVYISPSCERITGYDRENFLSNPQLLEDITHPDDKPIIACHIKEKFQSEKNCDFEFRIITRNGEIRWLRHICQNIYDSDKKYLGRRASNTDITALKKADDSIRESEKKFRCLFDNANDGMLAVDMEDRRFSIANKKICSMLGYTWEELKKLSISDIHPEESLGHVMNECEKQIRGEKDIAMDLPVKRKDGSIFYADINAIIITATGKTLLLGIFRDITERKINEEKILNLNRKISGINEELKIKVEEKTRELTQTQLELFHASKLISLGEMTSGIIHELKQPLTAINLTTRLISSLLDKGKYADIKSELDEIREAVKRMTIITDHVRVFSRHDALEFAPLNINKIVDSALSFFTAQLREHNIDLIWKPNPDIPDISGEPYQLERVFINLISNSRDAVDEKEQLISKGAVSLPDYNKRLEIYALHNKELNQVEVSFKDNGTGMSGNTEQKIFSPFYTTKALGTGLGLPLSLKIMKMHNGEIRVRTAAGEGTTMTAVFTLPDRV